MNMKSKLKSVFILSVVLAVSGTAAQIANAGGNCAISASIHTVTGGCGGSDTVDVQIASDAFLLYGYRYNVDIKALYADGVAHRTETIFHNASPIIGRGADFQFNPGFIWTPSQRRTTYRFQVVVTDAISGTTVCTANSVEGVAVP